MVTLVNSAPTRRALAKLAGDRARKTQPMADGKRCLAYVRQNGGTLRRPVVLTPRQRRRADKKLNAVVRSDA